MTDQQHIDQFRSHFDLFERHLNGERATRLHELRRVSFRRFLEKGFPSTREEEWRFTNTNPIKTSEYLLSGLAPAPSVGNEQLASFDFSGQNDVRLVFVNGVFRKELSLLHSLPEGVVVASLSDVLISDRNAIEGYIAHAAALDGSSFTALNTAFVQHGAFISVPENCTLAPSIHLVFFSVGGTDPFVAHPRVIVKAGPRSQLAIVENYVGYSSSRYFTNTVTQMMIGEGAVVEHDKLQSECTEAFHIGSTFVSMARESTLTSNTINLGGAIVRNNVNVVLGDESCECTLNGLSLGSGNQLIDNHTAIDHAHPNCASHELYKSILDGNARGVFNGKIYVRKDAQKTDAKQTNKTLLLSDRATIDTKPQLEIFADDVKCTHGATVGQLDEDQIFYLRARGIGEEDARDMLTFAFAGDVVRRIHVAALKDRLEAMLHARLRHGRIQDGHS